MSSFKPIVDDQHIRTHDKWGSGHYGARRSGGKRVHLGVDIVARPKQVVYSPIDGVITREARYSDKRYRGIDIQGSGDWEGYLVRLLYVRALLSGPVYAGQEVGFAQNIAAKYKKMTNHVHLQVKYKRRWINPVELYYMFP